MRYRETRIPGVHLVEPERLEDERGFFARTWCAEEFAGRGLNANIAQCGTSYNRQAGTLRGLHYQTAPHAEEKLVRCTRGAIFDVAVDLRPESPTLHEWLGVELSADNRRQLYVPAGCAHGFLTLADDTEVFYQLSASHHPESARGARWNDPLLNIRWPSEVRVISQPDRDWPLLGPMQQAPFGVPHPLGAAP